MLDYLLRLDRTLGRLFDEMDARVGKGRWLAVLAADHGVDAARRGAAGEGPPREAGRGRRDERGGGEGARRAVPGQGRGSSPTPTRWSTCSTRAP